MPPRLPGCVRRDLVGRKLPSKWGLESELSTASLRRTSLLANHLETGGGNRHGAALFGNITGKLYLVAEVGHKFCVVVRHEVTRNGVNLAVRGQQRYRLAHLGASCCAVRLVTTRHFMIDPSVRLVHLVAGFVDELA